jgi:Glycosyl transferase family 2
MKAAPRRLSAVALAKADLRRLNELAHASKIGDRVAGRRSLKPKPMGRIACSSAMRAQPTADAAHRRWSRGSRLASIRMRGHKPDESPELSLVIACYNEGEHLQGSVARVVEICDASRIDYELLFIDDGSTDDTREILTSLRNRYSSRRLSIHFNEQNLGRGATVRRGLDLARAPVAGFLDIDLEVDATYISTFYSTVLNGADLAIGRRVYDVTPATAARCVMSRGYCLLRRAMLGLPFDDTEAGYKFFRLASMRPVLAHCSDAGWFWDTEVVTRAYDARLEIAEVTCRFVRNPGKTSTVKPIRDAWRHVAGLAALRRSRRREGCAISLPVETSR